MAQLAAITGGFVFGVFVRSLLHFAWAPIVFVLILAAICLGASFRESRPAFTQGALFFIFLGLGMLRTDRADTPPPSVFAESVKTHVSYAGVVVGDPSLSDSTERAPVRVRYGGQATTILVSTARTEELSAGKRIRVSGTLELPQPFATDGGRTFRYDKYLEKDGIRFVMQNASVAVLAPSPWYSLRAFFAGIKSAYLQGLNAVLPEPYASLAAGISIGGKSGLGKDLTAAFTRTGLVQIIVLSGYNVMIIAEGVMALLGSLRINRRYAAIAGALSVVMFVLIAGASATALRALLMALIALYARATARSYAASRALLAVVFLMLLYNPLLLAFDPGFDLSVVATAGLIWLSPLIELRLAFVTNEFWRVALATTLAAQAAVLPLLLYETGNLSLISIPANLAVMPMVPLAMALAALAGMAGMVLGALATPLALPAYLATKYLILVANEAAALPGAAYSIPAFSFVFVLLAYGALAVIALSKRSSMTVQLRLSKKASI